MISFGQGLVKWRGEYYNPDKIRNIWGDNNRFNPQTKIQFDHASSDENRISDVGYCNPDKFAEAMVKAQQTGQIVDVEA